MSENGAFGRCTFVPPAGRTCPHGLRYIYSLHLFHILVRVQVVALLASKLVVDPTTEERLVLPDLLEKAGEGDFLRAVAEAVLQLLMESDVEGMIAAGR